MQLFAIVSLLSRMSSMGLWASWARPWVAVVKSVNNINIIRKRVLIMLAIYYLLSLTRKNLFITVRTLQECFLKSLALASLWMRVQVNSYLWRWRWILDKWHPDARATRKKSLYYYHQLPSNIQNMNPKQEPWCGVLPSGQAEASDLTKSGVPHTLSTTEKCFQQVLNPKRIQDEASTPNPSKATNSEDHMSFPWILLILEN